MASPSEGRRPRVLVVDDEPDVVELIHDLLESNGYEVIDGRDGLDGIVEGMADDIDAVVLDIMMPKADGIGVLNALKAVHPFLPVVMVTAKTTPEDVKQGFEWGCDAYICKPFEPDHLLAELRRVMDEATAKLDKRRHAHAHGVGGGRPPARGL